ncbi:ABC transporter ATP-binding protein [Catenuloplanes japonicus]|uniref:ABC transporter ATP-binding protein n=1 Tax=Catenuloplanes japonicus TaxID=33876 RepID=UPI00052715CA|nr:ABC transporter ATP-binding protein [Catenuloplanes japonicus]
MRAALRTGTAAAALAWRSSRAGVLALLALSLVGSAAPVAATWLTKLVIDGLATTGAGPGRLALYAAGLGAAGLLTAVCPQLTRYVRAEMSRRVGLRSRDELFRAVDRFVGLGPFEDPASVDRLRLAQRAGASSPNGVLDGAIALAGGGLALAGFLGSLVVISPVMAGVVVLAAAPALAAQLAIARRRAGTFLRIGPVERREYLYMSLLSTVEAAKEIRLFGTGGLLRARMLAERRAADRALRDVDGRELRTQSLLSLLGATVTGAGLFWAVTAAGAHRLTVGDIAMFAGAVAGVQAALGVLVTQVAAAHQHLLLFRHHQDVVTAGPDLPVAPDAAAAGPLRRGIELRDVWFRYSPDHPWVLRGVTITIPYGESVALVGRNGAGKSTIVKLLCRFYDPTRGTILWDGVDLTTLDPATLRARIGAVFQDFACYELSAADNVGLGDADALDDRARITTAATTAGAHDMLAALPRGYDTQLTRLFRADQDEGGAATGVVLSGGQWQRVALARGLLRADCDLLVCDEPNAGLDAEAEHEVHETLRRHRRGRTSVLVSHRLSALRDADRIVVLDGGVVVERGAHGDLVRAGGHYARLFDRQAEGYREAVP